MRTKTIAAAAALAAGMLSLAAPSCGSPRPRAVVVVTLDTFRADRMAAYGNADGLTPALDALAAESVVFTDASAPAPVTLPSHASLFTGRYPIRHGVRNNGTFVVPDSETTLAEILRGAGFRTGAVIASFPLVGRFGLAQGFDIYDDELPHNASSGPTPSIFFNERDARAVTDRALAVWKRLGSDRRFLWVHYFDCHAPYAPPEPWRSRRPDAPYDAEASWLDSQVARLLEAIRADEPDAVVVVVADHGESLGEHGEKTHGIFLYQSTIHVPFLLRAPGLPPRRVDEPVSLVDVLPTILSLEGLPAPRNVDGADLVRTVLSGRPAGRPVYAESYVPRLQFRFSELAMIRRGSLKWIDAPEPELYDLAEDPSEASNLAARSPRAPDLARELRELRDLEDASVTGRAAGSLDADAEARLRSLGYASAGTLPRDAGRGRDPKRMIDYLRRYDLAVGWMAGEHPEKAVALFEELLPEAPENVMARFQLAAALRLTGRTEEAERRLKEVVAEAPDYWTGYLALADAEASLGKIEDAIANYRAAAAVAPTLAGPHLALGRLLESVGRFDEAAAAYLEASRLAPRDPEPARSLLDLRTGRGDLPRAIADLRGVAEASPAGAGVWAVLATALRASGSLEEARAAAERSIAADPFLPEAVLEHAAGLLDDGRAEDALAAYESVLATRPRSPEAWIGRARCLGAVGRRREAEDAVDRLLADAPQFVPALVLRGELYEQQGEKVLAMRAYRRALALSPGDAGARSGLRRIQGGAENVGDR